MTSHWVDARLMRLPHGSDLPLPSYQSDGASGLDLYAAVPTQTPVVIDPGRWAAIPTGIAIALPTGWEGQVRPRSGLAAKFGVTVLNAPGTIDADYRGELYVLLINLGGGPFTVRRAMRIAQLILAPVGRAQIIEMDGLERTSRGEGGFGSTGLDEPGVAK